MDSNKKINQIQEKLDELLRQQNKSAKEIEKIQLELKQLTDSSATLSLKEELATGTENDTPLSDNRTEDSTAASPPPLPKTEITAPEKTIITTSEKEKTERISSESPPPPYFVGKKGKTNNFEKLLGENLINKAGILITIIGVGIGAKYSIEHNLLSPLLRIILGYLIGFGLLFFGMRLKVKYENYSAVLVSGALTIFYFISYFAYAFYELIPLPLAFALMFGFTLFTVFAALNYNKQVIAIIGLVGAYAVPFFLSNNSGAVLILFSYMLIINMGILILSIKKYWKPLFYIAFGLSWIIFGSWQITANLDDGNKNFAIAALFSSLFFLLFYAVFIFHKLIKEEKFNIGDIVLVLLNSFIYYGLGCVILKSQSWGGDYLGLFTLANAVIHFVVSLLIYRKKLSDRNIFYLISGLVLVFITITLPIQLSGGWITLSWALLASLLFWIGRTKEVRFYEILSYILMELAFFAFLFLPSGRSVEMNIGFVFFNVRLLISLLIMLAFGYINYLNFSKKYPKIEFKNVRFSKEINIALPAIFILIVFIGFAREINYLFEHKLVANLFSLNEETSEAMRNHQFYTKKNLELFKTIWLVNYSLVFVTALSFINLKFLKSKISNKVNLVLNLAVALLFLTVGLYTLKELRNIFFLKEQMELYNLGGNNILIRYLSIAFFAISLYAGYKCFIGIKDLNKNLKIILELALHAALLTILSSELMYWLNTPYFSDSYTISLTVLWGVYSFLLVAFGIWKKRKHLRIGAISLFGITLYKLFFYDISHFDTLSKTIVFIALGILLLTISFLYNKYKHIIFNDEDEATK